MNVLLLVVAVAISAASAQFGNFGNPLGNAAAQLQNQAQNLQSSFGGQFDKVKSALGPLAQTAEQLAQRAQIYDSSKKFVDNFNKLGTKAFKLALNPLSALTNSEFNNYFNGFNRGGKKKGPAPDSQKFDEKPASLPESVDWTQRGFNTPVLNQNLCAGCWAFAASGALEGNNLKNNGQLVGVSPQNFLDCVYKGEDPCATGGNVDDAFRYAKANGVNPDQHYPYENKTGQCRYKPNNIALKAKGFAEVPQGNEGALAAALATQGPIAVGINAGLETFQNYKEGIYDDEKCSSDPAAANHAVLLVGYGVENGKKFWKLKNTYGPEWGEGGYFRLPKDQGNFCGVANWAIFPVV